VLRQDRRQSALADARFADDGGHAAVRPERGVQRGPQAVELGLAANEDPDYRLSALSGSADQ
jgi:hypothetical protein